MKHKNKPFINRIWNRVKDALSPNNIIPFVLQKIKCSYCGVQEAKWKNILVLDYVCDECVPRGCSCHLYKKGKRATFNVDDYHYKKGKDGKELPCEDWEKID